MKVKIFTEGGKNIGLGHISRCSSLYDEISSRNIEVEFIIFGDVSNIDFLNDMNVINENWLDKEYLLNNISKEDYVIIDSYIADKEMYEVLARNSKKVLYIDDNGRINYPEGIIVNPSLDASHVFYSNLPGRKILTGSKYIILRSPFIGVNKEFVRTKVNRILIMMGGTDARNINSLILETLCIENNDLIIDVIIGNSQFSVDNETINLQNVNFHVNLTAEEMSHIMLKTDIAITAAGQTIFELIATKTPFIAIQTIENQKNNIISLSEQISPKIILKYNDDYFEENLLQSFENIKEIDFRKTTYNRMKGLIDGFGRKRIVDALFEGTNNKDNIILRKAIKEDIKHVFELSNQDYVRRYSINKNYIEWTDHVNWFKNALEDSRVVFYIVTDENNLFLGQVRYNIYEQIAIVSISLAEKLRNKGFSKMILSKSIEKFFEENRFVENIIAFVSIDNIASRKIFKRLNFTKIDVENGMIKLILKRGIFYANR